MFGLFKRSKPPLPPVDAPPAPGWQSIEAAFERLYPGQKARHWAHGGIRRMHDLKIPPENPLDGVSVYDGGSFWHYVTFGLSDLYGKATPGPASGLGYEITFRVARPPGEKQPPLWPIDVLVSLGRAAFSGQSLGSGHTIQCGPLHGRPENPLTALILTDDPGFEPLETPHGRLTFLQLVGVEGAVRERALQRGVGRVLEELRSANPGLVTGAPPPAR